MAARQQDRRPRDVDRHIGGRLHQRRVVLGLSQTKLAQLVWVSHQQLHKYEVGVNRVPVGRLFAIARALEVNVGYFFAGLGDSRAFELNAQQQMLLRLARDFSGIADPRQRKALCNLARVLATVGPDAEDGW